MENLVANIAGRVRIKDRVVQVDMTEDKVFLRLDDRAAPDFWMQLVLDRKVLAALLAAQPETSKKEPDLTGQRICHIDNASVEEANGAGDGAYDLFDIVGTPDEIGRAIGESLKTTDLYSGRCPSAIDAGHDLFLNVRIKVSKPQ